MIDFRYHIVSLIAIFLALGLGILLGSSVVSGTLVDRLREDSNRARAARNAAQDNADALKSELDSTNKVVQDQVSPWVVNKHLDGRNVVFISEANPNGWTNKVRDSVLAAGAISAGNLVLTDKWKLSQQGATEELLDVVVKPVVPSFDAGTDPASAVLNLLGSRMSEPTGRQLLDNLVGAGFITADIRTGDQRWPPAGTAWIIYANSHRQTAREPAWFAALARGLAESSPTLVTAGKPVDHSAVTLLRADPPTPGTLSTFDSAAEFQSIMEIAVVAALEAAINSRGGHFGTGADRRFVPQPA